MFSAWKKRKAQALKEKELKNLEDKIIYGSNAFIDHEGLTRELLKTPEPVASKKPAEEQKNAPESVKGNSKLNPSRLKFNKTISANQNEQKKLSNSVDDKANVLPGSPTKR